MGRTFPLWLLAFASLLSGVTVAAGTPLVPDATVPGFSADVFPPWQQGENNDTLRRGLQFTVPEVDDLADFHGDLTDPKLVLFVGGNYYFEMAPLVKDCSSSR